MSDRKRWVARLGGVAVGVAAFVGVNLATGRAIVPTVASVSGLMISLPVDPAASPGGPEPVKPPYQAVCGPCHQSEGQGIPYAFPPLAGSEWMIGDPETPIRIVLLGLSGEIEVKGTKFNLVMPPAGTPLPGSTAPPPPLDDAKIAEAITYARTNFGNNASAVDAELVKKVRDSLGGRTTPWTASELTALRTGAQAGQDVAKAAAGGSGGGATAEGAAAAPAGKKGARVKPGRGGAGPR
jgi:mono/diheme cytochrome c family protein